MQIDRIVELPGIRFVADLPLVSTIVASFLPSLVLRLFLAVLPYLLAFLGMVQGFVSLSEVEFSVVKKLFTFQVTTDHFSLPFSEPKLPSVWVELSHPAPRVQFLTVFLTSLIAGTILSQLQQFVRNPSSIITSVGAAAPQTATFFMLYLLLTGLIAKPLQFLRIPGSSTCLCNVYWTPA